MVRRRSVVLSLCLTALFAGSGVCQEGISWAPDVNAAIATASRNNQLVLLHFWAPGCRPCVALESNVFNRPDVAAAISQGFVPVKVNAENHPELARKYKVDRWPMDIVITPAGYPVHSMVSPQDPREYMQALYRVAAQRQPGNRLGSNPQRDISGGLASNGFSPQAAQQPTNGWGQPAATQPTPTQPADNGWGGAQNQSRFADAGNQQPYNDFRVQADSRNDNRFGGGQDARFGPDYADQVQPWDGVRSEQQANPHVAQQSQPRDTVNPFVDNAPARQNPTPISEMERQAAATPPIGMDGYCPVTLIEDGKWVKGDKRFGIIHRGRLYLFPTDEAKKTFWEDPDRFAPILSGNDPVEFAETGRVVAGSRKHGVFFRNQIYLFISEESLQRFWSSPQRYSDVSLQAMRRASEQIRR